jgi:CRISPR/Cas system CMR-associated protein Cmr1 (group 7 of RAMP superfamily)
MFPKTGALTQTNAHSRTLLNHLTPKGLKRRRAVSPLKIKIHSKNMREKLTNTPISFSLLIIYGSSYMFRHYIAILRERS